MEKETKAWNIKTGSAYVYCKKTEHGNYYEVSTKEGMPPWLVRAEHITFTEPNTANMEGNANKPEPKIVDLGTEELDMPHSKDTTEELPYFARCEHNHHPYDCQACKSKRVTTDGWIKRFQTAWNSSTNLKKEMIKLISDLLTTNGKEMYDAGFSEGKMLREFRDADESYEKGRKEGYDEGAAEATMVANDKTIPQAYKEARKEVIDAIYKKMDEYEYHKDEIHCTCLGALREYMKTELFTLEELK